MISVYCDRAPGYSYHYPICGNFDLPTATFDVTNLINVKSLAKIDAARDAIKQRVWGALGYPTEVPAVALGIVDARFNGLPHVASIDRLTFTLQFLMTGYGWRLNNDAPIGRTMIYHCGHGQGPDTNETHSPVAHALDAGYDVVVLCMPFFGDSLSAWYLGVEYSVAINGNMIHTIFGEAAEPGYGVTGYSVLTIFLGHVVQTLNLLAAAGVTHVSMVGLSGGGWTTCVMAALDERIRYSAQCAGTAPFFLRAAQSGDWESDHYGLYDCANFEDQYVMATSGGRLALQQFGWHDVLASPALFASYAVLIGRYARALTGGKWKALGDWTYLGHAVCPTTMATILNEIEAWT